MPTAHENDGQLIIDLGDGTTYTVPPLPGKHGKDALALLVGISLGSTLKEHGPEKLLADTERLTTMCLGVEGRTGAKRRKAFEALRASQQEAVGQAAILWNVQGGSIDAVNDLFDSADGGFPKALGRVMRSCGLGPQFDLLQTWLSGAGQAQS